MYIKTFMEDYENKGEFFPICVEISSRIGDWDGPDGRFEVAYTTDGNDKDRQFAPLFTVLAEEAFDRPSLLEEGEKIRQPNRIRLDIDDGMCLCWFISRLGSLEEQIPFDSLLEASGAEEYITIRIDILSEDGKMNGTDYVYEPGEIIETYSITIGYDDEDPESIIAYVSIETPDETEELCIY